MDRGWDSLNVSTTPITTMGCQQCLPLSVVLLKGKHCRKPHCRNGVVDSFGHWVVSVNLQTVKNQSWLETLKLKVWLLCPFWEMSVAFTFYLVDLGVLSITPHICIARIISSAKGTNWYDLWSRPHCSYNWRVPTYFWFWDDAYL